MFHQIETQLEVWFKKRSYQRFLFFSRKSVVKSVPRANTAQQGAKVAKLLLAATQRLKTPPRGSFRKIFQPLLEK